MEDLFNSTELPRQDYGQNPETSRNVYYWIIYNIGLIKVESKVEKAKTTNYYKTCPKI